MPTMYDRGRAPMTSKPEMRDLAPSRPLDDQSRRVDLREIGFEGRVSGDALDEIRRDESRANLVVRTAATFAFR